MSKKFHFKRKNPTFLRGLIRSAVYNVPPLEQSFFAAIRLALFSAVGKQNWTRLENKTPRDRTNEHEPKKNELKGQL